MSESQQFDVEAEVRSALPQVMAKVHERLMDRMVAMAEHAALQKVNKAVQTWAVDQLVPEIKAQLEAGKAGLIAKAAEIAGVLADEIGKAISENARKTLTSSSAVRDITERLFRGY